MRAWAVRDFAPKCPLYIQLFRPENKFHVKFADHVVCEDEFKYALLANNCLCPGISTFVTLLLHTSRGQEGQTSHEEWQRLYGKCSGNEIYHIRLEDSKFFGDYVGKSFTFASFHAHRKYGVSLVGTQRDNRGSRIQLNPGPRHIMRKSDICFYLNISKEENSAFILAHPNQDNSTVDRSRLPQGTEKTSRVASMIASVGTVALELQHSKSPGINSCSSEPNLMARRNGRQHNLSLPKMSQGLSVKTLDSHKRPSIGQVPATIDASITCISLAGSESEDDYGESSLEREFPEYVQGLPPVAPYVGTSPTLCHLMREKRPLCCLQLDASCLHCRHQNARDYNWPNPAIIVAAEQASSGLYNFIVPLRSHARPKKSLNPIVLLFSRQPDANFLSMISFFPLVFWMHGYMDCIEDLLKAGINLTENVVIVNKETSNSREEDTLADCNTIVSVQTIFRLFPKANILTEISHAPNMRFMQFRPDDLYALSISKQEKKERERGSNIYYMFRLPFAAGNVFSASMLDALLYQAFVKDYLITFVRLLLGIDMAEESGYLSSVKITKDDLWIRTYGRLYQKLCSTTCDIPIGIYRTQYHSGTEALSSRRSKCSVRPSMSMAPHDDMLGNRNLTPERQEIIQMVKCRMQTQGLPQTEYNEGTDKRSTISYVIINPSYDLKLELGDVVYVIRPSSLSPQPSPLLDDRKFLGHELRRTNTDAYLFERDVRKKSLRPKISQDSTVSAPPDIPIIFFEPVDSSDTTENMQNHYMPHHDCPSICSYLSSNLPSPDSVSQVKFTFSDDSHSHISLNCPELNGKIV